MIALSGEYYYIENGPVYSRLHRKSCSSMMKKNARFLGTFYKVSDALTHVRFRHKGCVVCTSCCVQPVVPPGKTRKPSAGTSHNTGGKGAPLSPPSAVKRQAGR